MVRYLRGADREDASCDQGEGIRDYNTINVSGFLICGGRGRAAVIQSKNITESTGTVDFFHGVWSWGTIRIPAASKGVSLRSPATMVICPAACLIFMNAWIS
jgi:hypothetical protein